MRRHLIILIVFLIFSISVMESTNRHFVHSGTHKEDTKINYDQERIKVKGISYTGSLGGTFNRRLYGDVYPRIRVYRFFLSTDSHTISVTPLYPDSGDDPGMIIYDPSGNTVASDWGYNGLTISFNAHIDGYYFIVVYLADDDGGNINVMKYKLSIDGVDIIVDYVYGENYESMLVIPADSIAVFDLYLNTSLDVYALLSWDTDDDLDLYVFSENSSGMYYSAGLSKPEVISFRVEPYERYTVLIHRYSAVAASTIFKIHVDVECSMEILSPKNLTVVRGIVKIEAQIYIPENVYVSNIYLYVDDIFVEDVTSYYDATSNILIHNWNTTGYSDGYHKVGLELYYTFDSRTQSMWKNLSILIDNIRSQILLVDDEPSNMESYYIDALESLGMSLHNEFEVWNTSNGILDLNEFDIVIWFTGTENDPITEEEIDIVLKYLDSGGNIFISSKYMARQWNGSKIFQNYFKAAHKGIIVPPVSVNSTVDSIYGERTFNLYGSDSTNTSAYSDEIAIIGDARVEMIYNDSVYCAALSYDGVYRLVYFAFPFESINGTTNRIYVMNKTLRYLNSSSGQQTTITSDECFTVKVFEDIGILANLKTDGAPMVGEEIYLYIRLPSGWIFVGRNTTDINGDTVIFLRNVSYPLGTYKMALVYPGNETFAKAIRFATLSVRRMCNKIELSYPSVMEDSGGVISVTVKDENDNPYSTTVAVVVMGNKFTARTDEYGKATIFIRLPPGNYTAELLVYETDYIYANSTTFSFRVIDDDQEPPAISLIDPPGEVSYNDDLRIRAQISDVSGIGSVILYYKINYGEYRSKPMRYAGDNIWEAVISRDEVVYGGVEWYIVAMDADNDWVDDASVGRSDTVVTSVVDNDPPTITGYSILPMYPEINDIITIRASVFEPSDASGVSRVIVRISGPDVSEEYNATFDGTSYFVRISGLKAGSYNCSIIVFDNAGNNASVEFEFDVSEIVTLALAMNLGFILYVGASAVILVALVLVAYFIKIRRRRE